MENKKNLCYRCKHFDRYYIQGTTKFDKIPLGRCFKTRATVDANSGCENFIFNRKNKFYAEFFGYNLSRILSELTQLRCILEELNNDDQNL